MTSRWIWPAVWFVVVAQVVAGALVYRGAADMFWATHRVLPLSAASSYRQPDYSSVLRRPEFWDTRYHERGSISLLQAWSGDDYYRATFAAPTTPDEQARGEVRGVWMRSLFPRDRPSGEQGPIASLRERYRPRIAHALPSEHVEWLVQKLG